MEHSSGREGRDHLVQPLTLPSTEARMGNVHQDYTPGPPPHPHPQATCSSYHSDKEMLVIEVI